MNRLSIAALLAFAAPAAAFAQEKEGMPQLDFGNPLMAAQIVWLGVIFLALYLLLSRWALPQVASVLEMRAGAIAADLNTARAAKEEADSAIAELTAATRRAHSEAQSAINASLTRAKAEAAEQAREANARLDAQLAGAEQRIAAARDAAMGALREVAGETAQLVVARLTGVTMADTQEVDAAVGRVLAARAA